MSFRLPRTDLMMAAAISRAPLWRSISRQDSLARASRPRVSTTVSAISGSFQGSVCISFSNKATAELNSGTCAACSNAASPRVTAQMAFVHFRRHFTVGFGPSMLAQSSSRARNKNGNFSTSWKSDSMPASSAMAMRPPRMTDLCSRCSAMVATTLSRPSSWPRATMARSSDAVSLPRMAISTSLAATLVSLNRSRASTAPP
mmetsp:Transcript_99479/g.309946  ORF Transcript_99479/g.309946 Transcript_99479/m.309946 type:complete len:202 (-) Transcript_99479:509-1114(-)